MLTTITTPTGEQPVIECLDERPGKIRNARGFFVGTKNWYAALVRCADGLTYGVATRHGVVHHVSQWDRTLDTWLESWGHQHVGEFINEGLLPAHLFQIEGKRDRQLYGCFRGTSAIDAVRRMLLDAGFASAPEMDDWVVTEITEASRRGQG